MLTKQTVAHRARTSPCAAARVSWLSIFYLGGSFRDIFNIIWGAPRYRAKSITAHHTPHSRTMPSLAQRLRLSLARLQCTLNFDRWTGYPQFATKDVSYQYRNRVLSFFKLVLTRIDFFLLFLPFLANI